MCCGGRKTAAIGIGRVNFPGAAPVRGEVRIHNYGRCAGGFFAGDVRFVDATRPGKVRVDGCSWHYWWERIGLVNFFGLNFEICMYPSFDEKRADRVMRLGLYYFMEQILRNWHIWWGRAGWPNFIMHEEQTKTEGGEGAPVHISAASARRRGPALAIKLSSCCEVARRSESEWADPRRQCQLKWRSARASSIFSCYPTSPQVIVALLYVFYIN